MSHARLAPSAAKRWLACPASVPRNEAVPGKGSEHSTWGTTAHAILERALLQQVHPLDVDLAGLEVDEEGDHLGLGFLVEDRYGTWDLQEMRDVAAVAYEHVLFEGDIRAETKVNPGAILQRDDCHGTVDIIVVRDDGVEVVDLKTGRGVVVEADDPQLRLYAAGVVADLYDAQVSGHVSVTLTVVQPRATHPDGPVRSYTTTVSELMTWMTKVVGPAAALTDQEDPPASPGEHCDKTFCGVRGSCPERADQTLSVFRPLAAEPMEELATTMVKPADQLTLEQVQYVLDHASLIEGWLAAVRNHALTLAKTGHQIPGYKLVAGKSNRTWDQNEDQMRGALESLGVSADDYLEHKLVSPAQAEKRVKPTVGPDTWAQIEAHIRKPPGAPTLAPLTDRRPAVQRPIEEVFQPIAGEENVN